MAGSAGRARSGVPGVRTDAVVIEPPHSPARRAFFVRALAAALASAWLPLAIAAEAKLARPDWRAIRKVIMRQLAALRAGDAARAFAYASPGIRDQFGDAATFLAMV